MQIKNINNISAKKIAALVLAIVIAAGMAAGTGCNKGTDPGDTSGTAKPTEAPATQEPEPLKEPEPVDLGTGRPLADILEGAGTKMSRRYYRKGFVVAVPVGKHYGFWGLAKSELMKDERWAVNTLLGDRVYTTAFFIANALGMRLMQTEDSVEFKLNDIVTLSFKTGENKATLNGTEYPAYPAQKSGSNIFIDCGTVAALLGYESYFDAAEGIFLMYPSDIEANAAEQINIYKERIQLYETVVFNTDDVPCDTTGSGLYEPVAFEDRQVGVAYTTWFRADSSWGKNYTWDIPMLGKYRSDDEAVIYQHGVWLANAGVDFVFVDWSNDIAYEPTTMHDLRKDFSMIEDATEVLFRVWGTIPGAPKICIFSGPGHVQSDQDTFKNGRMKAKNDQIYKTFIENEEFNKMYYYYEGKPLLMCYGATPSFARSENEYVDDRFTIRWVTGYVGQQGILHDKATLVSTFHWSWEERGAQTFTVKNGKPEAMTVVASWRKQSKEGQPGYIAPGLRDGGNTFKMQWARADLIGPKFALIVSFNEWHLGEQVSLENSKDIEPSETLGSLYLDIMTEQIRKFKGKA